MTQDMIRVIDQIQPPKLARVVKPQLALLTKFEDHMIVLGPVITRGSEAETSRHAQMNKQAVSAPKVKDNVLRTTPKAHQPLSFDAAAEGAGRKTCNGLRPEDLRARHGGTDEAGLLQIIDDRLDFR